MSQLTLAQSLGIGPETSSSSFESSVPLELEHTFLRDREQRATFVSEDGTVLLSFSKFKDLCALSQDFAAKHETVDALLKKDDEALLEKIRKKNWKENALVCLRFQGNSKLPRRQLALVLDVASKNAPKKTAQIRILRTEREISEKKEPILKDVSLQGSWSLLRRKALDNYPMDFVRKFLFDVRCILGAKVEASSQKHEAEEEAKEEDEESDLELELSMPAPKARIVPSFTGGKRVVLPESEIDVEFKEESIVFKRVFQPLQSEKITINKLLRKDETAQILESAINASKRRRVDLEGGCKMRVVTVETYEFKFQK